VGVMRDDRIMVGSGSPPRHRLTIVAPKPARPRSTGRVGPAWVSQVVEHTSGMADLTELGP
jgi:hypothetical protein